MSRCQRNEKPTQEHRAHTYTHTDRRSNANAKKQRLLFVIVFHLRFCYSSNNLAYFNPDWEESHRGSRRTLKSIKRGRRGRRGSAWAGGDGRQSGTDFWAGRAVTTRSVRAKTAQVLRAEATPHRPAAARRRRRIRPGKGATRHRRGRERDKDKQHGRAHNIVLIPLANRCDPFSQ